MTAGAVTAAVPSRAGGSPPVAVASGRIFVSGFKIDLIVRSDDDFQRHEFARRVRPELGVSSAWVISKEDLILSKLVWAAPSESAFQLRDVRKLLASGVDEAYLRHWSAALGVDALLRKCMDAGYDA